MLYSQPTCVFVVQATESFLRVIDPVYKERTKKKAKSKPTIFLMWNAHFLSKDFVYIECIFTP